MFFNVRRKIVMNLPRFGLQEKAFREKPDVAPFNGVWEVGFPEGVDFR